MNRSRIPYYFLALAAALAISAVVLLIVRWRDLSEPKPLPAPPEVTETEEPAPKEDVGDTTTRLPEEDPAEALRNLGIGASASDPGELVSRIADALEKGDLQTVGRLIGSDALDPGTADRLKDLAGARLRNPGGVREVGELELNARSRWALELEGQEPGRDRILLDLHRMADRKWSVEKITLPPGPGEPIPKAMLADPLGVADAFLQADLDQAAGRLAAVLDHEQADVLVGYDWHGNYGHPDHVRVHQVVRRAAELAAQRPRLFEATMNRDLMRRNFELAKSAGIEGAEDFDPDAPMTDGNPLGTPEAELNLQVDVTGQLAKRRTMMACHVSQVTDVGGMLAMPVEAFEAMFSREHYIEVGSTDPMRLGWLV